MGITLKELKAQCSTDTAALNADVFAGGAQLRNAGDLGAGVGAALEAQTEANAALTKECKDSEKEKLVRAFDALWATWQGPPLAKEYYFHVRRRWRMDYYHEPTRTAIEIHGGVWSNGRHVRGKGFLEDIEKMNAAAMQGITVLQLGTGQVDAAHVAEIADYVRRQMTNNAHG
jgi:hypothetical protein